MRRSTALLFHIHIEASVSVEKHTNAECVRNAEYVCVTNTKREHTRQATAQNTGLSLCVSLTAVGCRCASESACARACCGRVASARGAVSGTGCAGEETRGEERRGEERRGEAKRGEERRGEENGAEERRGEEQSRAEGNRGEERRREERKGEERRGEEMSREEPRGEKRRRGGEERRRRAPCKRRRLCRRLLRFLIADPLPHDMPAPQRLKRRNGDRIRVYTAKMQRDIVLHAPEIPSERALNARSHADLARENEHRIARPEPVAGQEPA
eukprot:1099444-Rhodomonas_salina.1